MIPVDIRPVDTRAVDIRPLDPASPEAQALLAQSDAYHHALYPAVSNHLAGVAALQQPNVHFRGVWAGAELVACGAVKQMDDDGHYGEIKRVWVPAAHRGRGYSRALMLRLEAFLRAQGLPLARLETGIHQPEALQLYRSLGYRERGPELGPGLCPFGSYEPDPMSLFLEKDLRSPEITPLSGDGSASLDGLAALLHDCVAAGASIGWVRVPDHAACLAFWQRVFDAVQRGQRCTWVATAQSGQVVGTVSLLLDQPENGALRAEVLKLMVHPSARRQGVGEALMRRAEAHAQRLGKRLLLLDTNTDSPAQALYTRLGWQLCGVMPDYAIQADGSLGATSWMFKRL